MTENQRNEFDFLLEEILSSLPAYVKSQIEKIQIIVEDEPSAKIRRDMGEEDEGESSLCGLHSGIPITEQDVTSVSPSSPVIMLFRSPILRLADGSSEKLRKEIRITLLHEIGHHFGFTEEKLEAMGYG